MLVLEVQATYFQPLSYNFNWFPSDEICSALTKTGKKKKTGKKGKGRKRTEKFKNSGIFNSPLGQKAPRTAVKF